MNDQATIFASGESIHDFIESSDTAPRPWIAVNWAATIIECDYLVCQDWGMDAGKANGRVKKAIVEMKKQIIGSPTVVNLNLEPLLRSGADKQLKQLFRYSCNIALVYARKVLGARRITTVGVDRITPPYPGAGLDRWPWEQAVWDSILKYYGDIEITKWTNRPNLKMSEDVDTSVCSALPTA